MIINFYYLIIFVILVLINLISFLTIWSDKSRSQRLGAKRIPEGQLFFLASMFGAFGIYAGMLCFRHKTKRWYFLIGIPWLILQNIVFVYSIYAIIEKTPYL